MLQAFLVVPGFRARLPARGAHRRCGRRILQLLVAGAAMIVVRRLVGGRRRTHAGLGPAVHRRVAEQQRLELTLGYNGLGRLTGEETGSVGGGMGGGARPGRGGCSTREIGGQIAWLLPAALILLAAGLCFARRAARTDRTRAALLLWGGWLIVTGLVFSFMAGIFHAYYTVALAPAVGALVGIGAVALWQRRHDPVASAVLAAALAVTAVWSHELLARSPQFHRGFVASYSWAAWSPQ